MIPREYAREALKQGLLLEDRLGTNPYKFGVVGSTDSHTSLATAEEENFFGKLGHAEPNPERIMRAAQQIHRRDQLVGLGVAGFRIRRRMGHREHPKGHLGRDGNRKEVYGTTGPRMSVRFFGGWDFEAADANNRLPGAIGYTKGVPMGGDLRAAPAGKAPTFLVAALKDPYSGNLDRVQIVKGWVDGAGQTQEQVYDVGLVRRPAAGCRWQTARGRQHGRRRERDVDQHDRCSRAHHRVGRPALRSDSARLLLRAGARDSDPALVGLRRASLRRRASRGRPQVAPGAGVHELDLVHALSEPRVMRRCTPPG